MITLRRNILPKATDYVNGKLPVQNARCLATETEKQQQPVTYEEVRIPVPWGHIAGKWWGPQNKRPILVLHGWQDNCGSFDTLLPLLPQDVGYLAIDMPGHGRSSQLSPGMFYHFMNGPILLRQFKEYFQWPKLSLLGHSLGSVISYTFGSLFPQSVDFVVCMDALNPLVFNKRVDMTVKNINEFVKYDTLNSSGKEPPSYTLEEMGILLNKATRNSISIENCKYILERNVAPSKRNPGKYYFARDARLKCGSLLSWTEEDVLEAAARVNFPILMTMASQTPFQSQKATSKKCIEIIKKNTDSFELHLLKGTHHVHLNDPEQMAKVVAPFIKKHNNGDRDIGIGDISKCNKV